MVLDDASGHWETGELAVISTCPLKNVSDAPQGVSVCCGMTGCTESRNVLPRERSELCVFLRLVEQVSQLIETRQTRLSHLESRMEQ